MKFSTILLIASSALLLSCTSSKTAQSTIPEKYNSASNLTEYLTQVPGLMVSGEGANATFKVRGVNSFMSGSDPLFVLDGTPMMGGYKTVYNLVDVKDIKAAKLVRGSDATFYGSRGSGGVVEIQTIK
ncbi:MAG: TonB-dependent receptor plug domain-containing protein [Bacteroidota bacterium]